MKINIITPFSRWKRFEQYRKMLLEQRAASWTLLNKPGEPMAKPGQEWLRQKFLSCEPNEDVGCVLINRFVRMGGFASDERYAFLMDDDWYPDGLLREIEKLEQALVVISMTRGDRQPAAAKHPHWTLMAAKENLHYGHVGLEQAFFRGDVLNMVGDSMRGREHVNQPNEDMILHANGFFHDKIFCPQLFVLFNWFEEGRWDKRD